MTAGIRLAAAPMARLRDLRVPVRLVLPFVVLVLPLAGAIWAVGNFAAGKEAERVDARLTASLRAAANGYEQIARGAEDRAARIASSPDVSRAFAEHDRAALEGFGRSHRGVTLTLGGSPPALRRPSLTRVVRVRGERGTSGTVRVSIPLDQAFIRRLRTTAGLSRTRDIRLAVLARGGRVIAPPALAGTLRTARVRPFHVRLAGRDYRAASSVSGPHRLVSLTPRSRIDAAERRARLVVLLAGLVTLLSVAVIAYLVAPAFARARVGKHEREQAARVLEHVADGVCLVDDTGRIRLWSPAAEAITGLDTTAVRDRRVEDAIPGWRKLEGLVPVSDFAAGDAGAPPSATVPLDVGGRELWLSVSAVRFSDGTVYAFRDLTEERRLEEMRSDLVTTVSHELRTPLASIHGAAATLRQREGLDEATRESLLAIVAEQSSRLGRLADEILLASELGRGHAAVRDEAVAAEEVAREAVEAARAQAGSRLSVILRVKRPVPPAVGDRDKIRQVLTNLLDNAVKYSPEGGRVEVVVEGSDGRVRLSVSDQGIGIPTRERERIFEKFYRLDPQLSRGVGGSGLGLYISRELLRYMGGRIWVEAGRGGGSVFRVELAPAPADVRVA